jgi:hypothetical protein
MKPIEAGPVAYPIDRPDDRDAERGVVRQVVSSGVEAFRQDARTAAAVGRDIVRSAPRETLNAVRRAMPVARAAGRTGAVIASVTAHRALGHLPDPDDLAHAGANALTNLARRATSAGGGAGTAWSKFAKYRTRWEA